MNDHKYSAQGTYIDNHFFPSLMEAKRYQDLKFLMKAREVKAVEVHPRFLLQPAFNRNGKRYKAMYYTADYLITYPDGRVVVEDVKGYRTKEFDRTVKLLLYRYPDITFRLLTKDGEEYL